MNDGTEYYVATQNSSPWNKVKSSMKLHIEEHPIKRLAEEFAITMNYYYQPLYQKLVVSSSNNNSLAPQTPKS